MAHGTNTTKCYSSTTPYYKVPLQYYKVLLMVQKSGLHQLVDSLSHYLQCFIQPRWIQVVQDFWTINNMIGIRIEYQQ